MQFKTAIIGVHNGILRHICIVYDAVFAICHIGMNVHIGIFAVPAVELILAACSLMTDLRRKDITCALPAIAVFGMLLFLLLWEARGRYVFSYVPVVLLLSAACASRPLDLEETVKEGRVCRAIKSLAQRIFAR